MSVGWVLFLPVSCKRQANIKELIVISIPILLLYKAQFRVIQKISVGIILSLSIVMIGIALVRGISYPILGTSDQTWSVFWIQLQSSISVIMVCIPAFRTLFVAGVKRSQNKNSPRAAVSPSTWRARLFRKKVPQFLPDIETGGMCIFF